MIPTQELVEFPEFANTGSKTEPDAAKYAEGFVPADVFPAEHANWLFNKASKGITEINAGLESVEEELNNLVEAAGAEPSAATSNQVLNAINYIIDQAILERSKKENPIGKIIVETTGTNPAETLGFGTWEAYAEGRVLVGVGTGRDDEIDRYFPAGSTGGEYNHTLEKNEMPSHNHTLAHTHGIGHNHGFTPSGSISTKELTGMFYPYQPDGGGNLYFASGSTASGVFSLKAAGAGKYKCVTETSTSYDNCTYLYFTGTHNHTFTGSAGTTSSQSVTSTSSQSSSDTTSAGGTAWHNNIQPYIAVYFWRRTA